MELIFLIGDYDEASNDNIKEVLSEFGEAEFAKTPKEFIELVLAYPNKIKYSFVFIDFGFDFFNILKTIYGTNRVIYDKMNVVLITNDRYLYNYMKRIKKDKTYLLLKPATKEYIKQVLNI